MRSWSAFRAYSIDGMGAMSRSPSSGVRAKPRGDARHLLDVDVEAVKDRRHVDVRDAAEPHRCLLRTTHVTTAARIRPPQRMIAGVDTS